MTSTFTVEHLAQLDLAIDYQLIHPMEADQRAWIVGAYTVYGPARPVTCIGGRVLLQAGWTAEQIGVASAESESTLVDITGDMLGLDQTQADSLFLAARTTDEVIAYRNAFAETIGADPRGAHPIWTGTDDEMRATAEQRVQDIYARACELAWTAP